jgi:hypothetical protein
MISPPRFQDWPARLEAYFDAARQTPFEWGRADCLHFAMGVVKELTGRDVVAELGGPGAYEDSDGAQALCLSRFDGVAARLVDSVLPRAARCAGRGNVVLFRVPATLVLSSGFLEAFGIIDGTGRRIAARTETGVRFLPLPLARAVWTV